MSHRHLAVDLIGVEAVSVPAVVGADVATCPPKILYQMMAHPLTDIGLAKFLADWESVPK